MGLTGLKAFLNFVLSFFDKVNPKIPFNMFVVRDVFNLKYGMFKEAVASIRQAVKEGLLPEKEVRILSDFTGEAYRLIMESGYASLADYVKGNPASASALTSTIKSINHEI